MGILPALPVLSLVSKLRAMRLRREAVRWLSGWLVLALLFMQLATVVHACPRLAVPDPQPAAQDAMPGCTMAGMSGADDPASLLCRVHCQQGQQAFNPSAPAADLAGACVLVAVLDWAVTAPAGGATPLSLAPTSGVASGAPPPGALPIYLSLLVLRN